ncbi:hypothetical protein GSI01S_11_00380 [Gordonia sihwensis NBRC 108236]|uniref:GIY-YIG domain-containing protein n=1 Tax=Gordonia sihwensis NBRC 108236 TaxID=1223544 RepID=L7LKS4_9ACTN|nr:hypothetical protein GSI01S_11_00380 [Gordonia sihwensis NBRC 108236]
MDTRIAPRPDVRHSRLMHGFMYILKCADGSYYVGSTRNIEHRFEQHQSGRGSAYTRNRCPVELVFCEEFDSIEDAYAMERRVSKWSRAKREALIAGDFDALRRAAKKGFRPGQTPPSRPQE